MSFGKALLSPEYPSHFMLRNEIRITSGNVRSLSYGLLAISQTPSPPPPLPTLNLDFQNLKDAILGHTHRKFCTIIDVVITKLYVFSGVPLFPLAGHIS